MIHATRFGEIEVESDKVITFPEGILAFMESKEYLLIDHSPGSPIRWLQSLSEPDLAFVVIDPFVFKPDYKVVIHPEEIAFLGVQDSQNLLILTIITIPLERPEQMTANLKGPIVINLENRLAKQIVLYDFPYPTRYPLYETGCQKSSETVEMERKEIPA